MSELRLELASDALGASEADGYPSRNGQNAKLIDRQDPIVYASKEQAPPVDRPFIDTYNEQGFVVLDEVFTPDEVATFQQELERLKADPKSSNPVRSLRSRTAMICVQSSVCMKAPRFLKRLQPMSAWLTLHDICWTMKFISINPD